jgi:crotonobetainyl-CoA:carnitine CoA-transferase CaiB-like acyl-CoA transferase
VLRGGIIGGVDALVATCWEAAGGEATALDGLEVTAPDAWLGGRLAVDDLAVGAVAAALLTAADLVAARNGPRPAVTVSAEHIALSFVSERHAQKGGAPAGAGFAPLSRVLRCAGGGWARTHGNYPHHAAALGRALAIDPDGDPAQTVAALQDAAASLDAAELEERVVSAGGCAAALRTASQWADHPAGGAAGAGPLIAWDAAPAAGSPADVRALPELADPRRPAGGLRVLDLTRVIAGPVAGRTLAALGADVLRIDPPGLPEMPQAHLDTGPGKRSALLDLADRDHVEELLAGADVLLAGYRPGALARFGLDGAELAGRHPHLVQVWLSAWGHGGPWRERRGFDSLVQVASGIAAETAAADGTPGVLPAQALDHATGHLMAAAALRGLVGRAGGASAAPARLSLARTAAALLAAPRRARPRSGPRRPGPPIRTRIGWRSGRCR